VALPTEAMKKLELVTPFEDDTLLYFCPKKFEKPSQWHS
jgi:hypothetical protein